MKKLLKHRRVITGIVSSALLLTGCSSDGSFGNIYYGDNEAVNSPFYDNGYFETFGEENQFTPIEADEEYKILNESPFKDSITSPLSTFSSDVDTTSYSNMRRFINHGQKPEGIRIEELINYFPYNYPLPESDTAHPFTITTEVATCPWNSSNYLAMIGIQGETLRERAANNIVFLLDVSGSMNDSNKLPLLKESFKLLVDNLTENDVISIVTYAGDDKIVADSVPGNEHSKLKKLIGNLSAGGSTAGAKGIATAYDLADKNYIDGGNNRIILATDGDFNVGVSSVDGLNKLIETRRDEGIFISVLGFGMGNLKDNMMETISNNGNGNYAYIDTLGEAKKVLIDEFDSTMYVIAKDMKIQIEFNPGIVKSYRLIGYDNRRMENEDFNNDLKDAGDVGAGHSVTAFYELVLTDGENPVNIDDLTYSQSVLTDSNDYMTVKVRYKKPEEDTSNLVTKIVTPDDFTESPSDNFIFASAIAEFGLILTDSGFKSESSIDRVITNAKKCIDEDGFGLREEFVGLVNKYNKIIN